MPYQRLLTNIPEGLINRMADAMVDPTFRVQEMEPNPAGRLIRIEVLERALCIAAKHGWVLANTPGEDVPFKSAGDGTNPEVQELPKCIGAFCLHPTRCKELGVCDPAGGRAALVSEHGS